MMIEAMKQALEALELMYACYAHPEWISHKQQEEKILAQCVATSMTLRQAIAEAEKQQDIFKQLGSQSWLQLWQSYCDVKVERDELKDKLAEAEKQEPVGVFREDDDIGHIDLLVYQQILLKEGDLLYTHPPKREPLTDEEIATISVECATVSPSDIYFARAIEAAHGIKGQS
jgi:hypothetical protein